MDNEEYIPRHANKKSLAKKKVVKVKTTPILLVSIILISILSFSLYKVYVWYKDNENIENINKDLQKDIKLLINDKEGKLVNPDTDKNSDYWYYVTFPFYEVDFDVLKSKNSDTVAFIHMNNTNINYPIVQTKDNDYYLNHAFNKSKNSAGWVFMDYRNNIDNLSDNTIIYGHGRLNKTVFGSLKNALTSSWQKDKDNYIIWISTPKSNMLYQIFSIYTIEQESYYIRTSFISDSAKEEWLNTMKKRNTSLVNTSVNTTDKILTLSTCLNNTGGRIVVQAKLIKIQER